MKFVVRYWSSLLPNDFLERRNEPRWVDYSIHPASKIGLHNAMLAVHDRCEIMHAHGCRFECAVFVVESDISERLSQETANSLFASLPSGDVKWLDIKDFLLPVPPILMTPSAVDVTPTSGEQLPLFDHVHTPYDDIDVSPHLVDIAT